jgi:hypothetical protein
VSPPVAKGDLAALDDDGVVAPGVSVGPSAGMGELAIELDSHAEAVVHAVGADPKVTDDLADLEPRGGQIVTLLDIAVVAPFEG